MNVIKSRAPHSFTSSSAMRKTEHRHDNDQTKFYKPDFQAVIFCFSVLWNFYKTGLSLEANVAYLCV